MAWIYLGVAGLLEVVWAFAMKLSEGFTRPWPTAITLVAMVASVWFLSLSMKVLPLGTAYVIWTGIGAVGTFVLGMALLGESADALRLVAAVLIVAGLVLMKIASPH
ncbi:multidrug efflux SMR transporter [Paracoccus sp. PS-1]|uniref:DMT family transporter n=1 Tax=unclassified Paracoccus (in: a-proteobacteria) TaxID=2688777 RepID=UPI00048C0BFF|nr:MULTISPECIES: multidrug efflux SMR transporter [unclassified Paracoccus (in: a-proteobacteria)]MDQ7261157.1 multidrug efflux SMR transporter [Paracoccus sp. PS1]UFM64909.1 multidrug efflux SMR transporter [Paracoccus sp. MA]